MTDGIALTGVAGGWIPPNYESSIKTSDQEQSEAHENLNKTFDGFHSIINKRLDELQKIIDEVRLVMADDNKKIKEQVGKHLNAAQTTLKLTDDVGKELEIIKLSLNGAE